MKVTSRAHRRNKSRKAVRRLRGIVQSQANQLKAAGVQVESLGGRVNFREDESKRNDRDQGIREEQIENLAARVVRLERVPKLLRWFFGAA